MKTNRLMGSLMMAVVCVLLLAGCKNEIGSDIERVEKESLSSVLPGIWVYDNPKEGVWETLKFTETATFYFSNEVPLWGIDNERNDGRYFVNDETNEVTGSYTLDGRPESLGFQVVSYRKFEITCKFPSGTFTYNKLIDSIVLENVGDKSTPDVESTIKSATLDNSIEIYGYTSHDTEIATVDHETGEITAVAVSGRTYVEVSTNYGTAVIEVVVYNEENLFGDYSWAYGKTIDEVIQQLGNDYFAKVEGSGISYPSKNLAIKKERYLTSMIDDGHIAAVQLEFNSNYTTDQLKKLLDKKYKELGMQKDMSYAYLGEDDLTVFLNPPTDTTNVMVTLSKVSMWPNFNHYFGMTTEQVETRMEQNEHELVGWYDSYSANGSIAYKFTKLNAKAYAIEFVFNPDNVVCQYLVYLNPEITGLEVLDYLDEQQLTEAEDERPASGYGSTYYNGDKTLRVDYDLVRNALVYTDLTLKAFVPVMLGSYWQCLGKTRDEVIESYSTPDKEDKANGRLLYAALTDYVSRVYFFYNTETKVVNLINLYLRDGVAMSTVNDYLNLIYKKLDSGTNDNGAYTRWINGETRESSSMIITYYSDYGVIVYQHPSTASSRALNLAEDARQQKK